MTLTEWIEAEEAKPAAERGAFKQLERDSGLSYSSIFETLKYGSVPRFGNAVKLRDALAKVGCDLTVEQLLTELSERARRYKAAKLAAKSDPERAAS